MTQSTIKLNKKVKGVRIIASAEFGERGKFYDWGDIDDKSSIGILDELKIIDTDEISAKQPTREADGEIYDSNIISSENKIDIEDVRKQIQVAYDQGFTDGQDTTTASFQAQIQQHQKWLRNLDSVISELRSEYTREIVNLEESIVTLAIMVAEKIIEQEISVNSEIVIRQVKKGLESLDNETIFKIRLHPENIDVLERVKSRLFTDGEMMSKVQLVPDSSVDYGGCILETSAGIIDARIRTQLEKISRQIEDIAKLPPEM